ncbi:coenzyme F420-0:L-glutamate ligase [Arthrobacter sunyaminii]|uniref:Coenzyme F420-0:L-glutamate ligase n=1 Tax=Arthrobacter sunyaminii TaxID=2816859 RepID=A0A975XL62_9MICC|nr:coenzyme F420-0:L-glutamate ligase [Arthrobacter sunyaminii]MBO0910008.1 coenzyme F420-0:L-glutamate ligase [Arthrobacter sunyaminii]QWQ36785.1 coenzyme F420-0:L-glutamate ligase [Arthrobacter sunyaminii]
MRTITVFVLPGISEITPGADLVSVILDAAASTPDAALRPGDILVVTSKIVSKAEGRQVAAEDREQCITEETVRVVASKVHSGGVTRIVENKLGIVAAAAGVDNSNTPAGTVLLLPVDPDASARALCAGLRRKLGFDVGVLITDTLGRAWRDGQTDAAIGAAGVDVLLDLRGTSDAFGQEMKATLTAVADEIAGAADLVKGKTSQCPVAVLRGLPDLVHPEGYFGGDRGARALVRPPAHDLFRLGSAEAWREGYAAACRDAGLPEPLWD